MWQYHANACGCHLQLDEIVGSHSVLTHHPILMAKIILHITCFYTSSLQLLLPSLVYFLCFSWAHSVFVCVLQPCYQKARQWLLDNISSVLVFGVCIGVVQVIISNIYNFFDPYDASLTLVMISLLLGWKHLKPSRHWQKCIVIKLETFALPSNSLHYR